MKRLEALIDGLQEFRETYYAENQELFESLAHGQKPKFLFITCSDSRVDPNLITHSDIGELFVLRNAGNIVPPFGSANGGEGAAIEYAITALGIEQVIICGHSHCGAMKGLLKLSELETEMPLVYEWLRHSEGTLRLVKDNYTSYSNEELIEITIAENVLTQIDNLKTYPIVRSRLYQGKLKIYGWIYHIETGEVLAYDPVTHAYKHPQSDLASPSEAGKKSLGQFIDHNSRPLVCNLPFSTPKAQKVAKAEPKAIVPDLPATANLPLATSPQQAARIYRGSKR
ncbi:MAG: carbonic anhydrase [Thermosynechococcaceae cyanobacterium MS004]|nr:carbonic anhydrase [Thermosynechococcaceae cyanobacterium MS004]